MAGDDDLGKTGDQFDLDRSERTAESTAEDAVIAGDRKREHQQRYQEMEKSGLNFQGMNKLGEKDGIKPTEFESVTIVALSGDGEIKASGKTGLNEKDLEQATIPTNAITAWDHRSTYRDARQNGLRTDIVRVASPPDILHPFAGHELDIVSNIPDRAWNVAASLFPEFTRAGIDPERIQKLCKAILANELEHYDRSDQADDTSVRVAGSPLPRPGRSAEDATLGYAQISVNGVKKLSQKFPQVLEYLTKCGYAPGQEMNALNDPKIAPVLIAANLAQTANMYQRHHIPVNEQTLGYGFNPDISFNKTDAERKNPLTASEAELVRNLGATTEKAILPSPSILEKSEHVLNIRRWLERLNKNGGNE